MALERVCIAAVYCGDLALEFKLRQCLAWLWSKIFRCNTEILGLNLAPNSGINSRPRHPAEKLCMAVNCATAHSRRDLQGNFIHNGEVDANVRINQRARRICFKFKLESEWVCLAESA